MEQSSICGNSCTECPRRVSIGCPGCRLGPGQYLAKVCEIAQCAGERNIRGCAQCYRREECETRAKREENQNNRLPEQCRRQTSGGNDTAAGGKDVSTWLWLMFAVRIASAVGGGAMIWILELVALWQLGKHEQLYKESFWWNLAIIAASIITVAIVAIVAVTSLSVKATEGVAAVAVLIFVGLELCAKKYQYAGHKKLLKDIDGTLVDTFESLWNWDFWLSIVLNILLVFYILGAWEVFGIGMLLWLIPGLIFTVRHLTASFKMAKTFSSLGR